MRYLIITIGLFSLLMTKELSAKSCSDYEVAYDIATYTMKEEGQISNRKSYDLVNTLIDTATEYLAYCNDEISLADQYQIQQSIKRADNKRREYFKGAIREYHAIYGIRPNVTEIYQDGSFSSGSSSGTSGPSSPPRFPPVMQPQMPPVQR
ncbi:MAG: hypothetical protein PF439_00700 [Helicobacteraceae bacterium]|jgi:hypothetical protein|nr:hypothetical protein [Helicobacteraceae bacterium]